MISLLEFLSMYILAGYDRPLAFDACQNRSCRNLTIVNDEMLEEIETLEVTLEIIHNVNNITIILDPVTAEIHIIDDDGMLLYTLLNKLHCFTHHIMIKNICSIILL